MTPVVSVVTTAYNRQEFIRDAIDSVLASAFRDLELIVVDDASTDATYETVKAYERIDPRVRVFRNERNLGDYANRNRAASYARGRYVKFHDSDDVMYPHCLPVMLAGLEQEPTAGFALSRGNHWPGAPVPMLSSPRMSYAREFLGSGVFGCGPGGALFRREVFEELGGFEDVGSPSDYVFWLRACARYSIVLVAADLFFYRVHAGQSIHQAEARRHHAAVMAARGWAALHDPACPLAGADLQLARRNHVARSARPILGALRSGEINAAWFHLSHSGLSARDWLRYLRPSRRSPHEGSPAAVASPAEPVR